MTKQTVGKKRIFAAVITVMLCVTVFVALYLRSEGIFFSLPTDGIGEDFVKVIDVGQGDSILISSNGYNCLIDTGTVESSNELVAELYENNIEELDVLVLSHLHIDHTGGVSRLFESIKVKNLILPELSTHSEGIYSAQLAINEVSTNGNGVYSATEGMNFLIGDFEITVLASYGKMNDENNRSLVMMAEIEGKKFLFTGDAEEETEKALIEGGINLDCDVLKVGHHGSNSSSSKQFLNAATPNFAAISVGKANSYGHPHRKVLNELENRRVKIFRTDYDGDIIFKVENNEVIVATQK